jgi:hypothetical protein
MLWSQITVRGIVSVALFIFSISCVLRSNSVLLEITREVNRRRPMGHAFALWSFSLRWHLWEILAKHRRFYPDGKLLPRWYFWTATFVASSIGLALCLLL